MGRLRPGVVKTHLLLGIPAQLTIAYDDQLFESMGDTINAATAPELVSKATLSDDEHALLRQWRLVGTSLPLLLLTCSNAKTKGARR